jgi:DNA repair protein RecN (Recombination protein N)
MLLGLHVKNLALIEEEEVSFSDGLNILTGETGAGKSIIIGSVNLALGAKADKGFIRTGEDYALIEMTFSLDNERQRQKLRELEIAPEEDGTLLIKRKIYPGRSVCTVGGETVTTKQMREIAELLIDIYGQRENQKLLRREAQLGVIDDFAGEQAAGAREEVRVCWQSLKALEKEYAGYDIDNAERTREIDLLTYEAAEIESAQLRDGEDEKLESDYRRLSNFRRITEAVQAAGGLSDDSDETAAGQISRALRAMNSVGGLDPALDGIAAQLSDVDSLLSDFDRALSDYMAELSFDPQEFEEIEERLNLINHLKDKYGRTIPDIAAALEKKQKRLLDLSDFEAAKSRMEAEIGKERDALLRSCEKLSKIRKAAADEFTKKMTEQLLDLNFNQVDFRARLTSGPEQAGPDGYDKVMFLISMNPGEKPRPLENIASGGELSRIMLALKTVFAGKDEIHTFIFDEIDSGISGQTAWKVAQKMGKLARDHQILCITHLPQIAAMEDAHYCIEKSTDGQRTVTHIRRLTAAESLEEMGRLLGGSRITQATLDNAKEMKDMAADWKRGA